MSKDGIYSELNEELGAFVFDEKVANVFQDMIQRSVPGYEMSLSMIALIARRYAQSGSAVYDLGCSLGASSLALVRGNPVSGLKLIGVDYSELEISQKRSALEDVLIPESIEDHKARFSEAGFSRSGRWFQCFNFASLIAFKD